MVSFYVRQKQHKIELKELKINWVLINWKFGKLTGGKVVSLFYGMTVWVGKLSTSLFMDFGGACFNIMDFGGSIAILFYKF